MLQRLEDLRKGRVTFRNSLTNNAIKPTLKEYTLADMRLFFPSIVVDGILTFIKHLARVCGHLSEPDTLVYAPALEWCMKRIDVDQNLQTKSVKGLFVACDGAGLTQGVVVAAMTGIRIGRYLAKSLKA